MNEPKIAPQTLPEKSTAKSDKGSNLERIMGELYVPLFFAALCLLGIIAAGLNPRFLVNEIITRLARNSFLVLS